MQVLKIIYQNFFTIAKKNKYLKIIGILSGIFTTYTIFRPIYHRLRYKIIKKLPYGSAGALPLFGVYPAVLDYNWCKNKLSTFGNGQICMTRAFLGDIMIINDPQIAKKIYSDSRATDKRYNDNLTMFLANGEMWAIRRKIIHNNLLSTLSGNFVNNATQLFLKTYLIPEMQKNCIENKPFDCKKYFHTIGFNITLLACFGKSVQGFSDEFYLQFVDFLNTYKKFHSRDLLASLLIGDTLLTKIYNLFGITHSKVVWEKLITLVKNCNSNTSKDVQVQHDAKTKFFNDYVREYGSYENKNVKLTSFNLYSDMIMMFFAAMDTSYSSLCVAFLLAAKNQNLQEVIYQELIASFPDKQFSLNNHNLRKIPKLRAFIFESLRLYPVIHLSGERTILNSKEGKNIKIECSDGKTYELHKNIGLFINAIGIHHNAKFWKNEKGEFCGKETDMNKVHLEFWIDEDGSFYSKRNNCNLLGFSTGRRQCIGRVLAIKQMIIALGVMFMEFKILPNNDLPIEMFLDKLGGILEPRNTVCRLVQRPA